MGTLRSGWKLTQPEEAASKAQQSDPAHNAEGEPAGLEETYTTV